MKHPSSMPGVIRASRGDKAGARRRSADATSSNIAQLYLQIPAMAVVLDERGIILALSRECAIQFSSHATRLVGRSILSLAHQDDRDVVAAALADAARNRDRIAHCEFRVWRGEKPPLDLHASVRAAHRGDGPAVLHAVCSDITDRVSLEQLLERQSSELSELASELLVVQDRERRRIAADMHDTVGHNLALAKFSIDGLRAMELDTEAQRTVDRVRQLLQDTIDAVRCVTYALDASPLQGRGLDAAVEDLGQSMSADTPLQFSLSSRPRQRRLAEPARIALYRAVRELLVNVAKHANADTVRVSIGDDASHLNIMVADNGSGIDTVALSDASGRGLRHLQRQIEALDGTMTIRNRDAGGTAVTLRLPYTRIGGSAS